MARVEQQVTVQGRRPRQDGDHSHANGGSIEHEGMHQTDLPGRPETRLTKSSTKPKVAQRSSDEAGRTRASPGG